MLPGQAVHCLLMCLHPTHCLQLVIQHQDTAIGLSHGQQELTLDRAEGQREWDVVQAAADDFSDGRLAASEEVDFS